MIRFMVVLALAFSVLTFTPAPSEAARVTPNTSSALAAAWAQRLAALRRGGDPRQSVSRN